MGTVHFPTQDFYHLRLPTEDMCGLFSQPKGDSDEDGTQRGGFRRKAWAWTKQNVLDSHQGDGKEEKFTSQPSTGPSGLFLAQTQSQGLAVGPEGWRDHDLCFQAHPTSYSPRSSSNVVSIAKTNFLGTVRSATTHVTRDLGFQGQIGQYVLLTYGDTMYSDGNYSDHWRGMTSDSVALATKNPLVVIDPNLDDDGYPKQFCPVVKHFGEDPAECALGITNVVETEPGQGILYFLLNHRPGGINNLKGAGVATVALSDTYPPVPSVKRLGQYWWDGETEPWYGDVGAIRTNGYIYSYGHAKDNPWVYLARVRWQEVTSLDAYEYWNGDNFQKERLKTKDIGEKESVFWQINQGQVIWSEHFNEYLFVYCDNFWNSKVQARRAPAPEGPWSEAFELYQAHPITEGSTCYAAVPHPYYDPSGKTLVVTFTNHPNTIQAVRVTFA